MSEWSPAPSGTAAGQNWSGRLIFHSRWLRTVIAARSRDASAVDEVYQEVALAVVKQEADVPDARVAPWLYRIAVRQALLYRRRLGRQRRLQANFSLGRPADAEAALDP